MSEFVASSTVTVRAHGHDVWALWVDVNAWNAWNVGIEQTQLHGNFKAGNSFTLVPKGGRPVEVTLTTVTQGDEFVDEAAFPFGTIRNIHRLESCGDLVRVTHQVEAEVGADEATTFYAEIWPSMQRNLFESLDEMVDILR